MDAPKKLSLVDATLLVMGGIIGVGIFFNPSQVARGASEPWAFVAVWLVGGIIALFAAFTFAELGGTFPRTGGWFVYSREGFGPFPAFVFAWIVLFVVSTGAVAGVTGFLAEMVARAFPELLGEADAGGKRLLAASVVLLITAIALTGVKRTALVQNACMVIKLVVIAAFVILGFALVAPAGDAAAASPADYVDQALVPGMFAALRPVLFAYGGWQMAAYIAPELRDAQKNLPRAIVAGVLGVIACYLFANLAYLRALGIEGLATDEKFAARLAREAFGALGERLLAVGMAVSCLGFSIVTILATPWLYVAMSNEGLFFRRFGRLSPRTQVPAMALVVQAGVTLVYLYAARLSFLVDAVVFVEWIFHGLVALALLRLRKRRPELPRPFASPLYPLAPAVYVLAAVVVVVSTLFTAELRLTLTGLAIVGAGALIYAPWRKLVAR